ncbi:MAG: amidase [Rhodospirillaceae bacterium]|nr:amidase [Rhodospirillaceae bacterium]|tara:strand:- start:1637 stop:2953 length:1317 start_codon:yes stop_codon:yes gene_type:complete
MSKQLKSVDFTNFSVVDAVNALASGELSSSDLVTACLKKITTDDRRVNAFVHVASDCALVQAQESDNRRKTGKSLSSVDGIPIALKDNIDVKGQPTTNGLGTKWIPETDAKVVAELRARGMVFIGKTNMHEAALGATTNNPHYGKTNNPKMFGYTAGGSSGGSGAAVGAFFCPAALGTDTMGSVRVPAAYCGTVGFKPTRNYWSTVGVTPLSTTLDTVGPLARAVADVAVLMELPISHVDSGEIKLSTLTNFENAPMEKAVSDAYTIAKKLLSMAGIGIISTHLKNYEPTPARRTALLVCEVEGFSVLERLLSTTPYAFSDELTNMLNFGSKVLASKYLMALQKLDVVRREFLELLEKHKFIVSPTTPQTAFSFGNNVPVDQADFTALANFVGCPAISIPIGVSQSSMPVGLQVIAAPGQDKELLSVAVVIQNILYQN